MYARNTRRHFIVRQVNSGSSALSSIMNKNKRFFNIFLFAYYQTYPEREWLKKVVWKKIYCSPNGLICPENQYNFWIFKICLWLAGVRGAMDKSIHFICIFLFETFPKMMFFNELWIIIVCINYASKTKALHISSDP